MQIEPVAYYHGPLEAKFGLPRQSGLAPDLRGRIVFTEAYRNREALRGLEGFDRIWLIWAFSANKEAKGDWQPTVRPPRLGGNTALGVWATRSPYRPNPLGLSCVRLEGIDPERLELRVSGADLMDGTPVFDIKPYVVYADCFPEASSGFASSAPEAVLRVEIPASLPLSGSDREILRQVLSLDPRPPYHEDADKVYGMPFRGRDIRFRVREGCVYVMDYA